MSEFEIIHRDYDRDGELSSMLVLEDGEPTQINATPKNILLYEHGMRDFLSGDGLLQFGESLYAGGNDGDGYVIVADGERITIPPKRDSEFLQIVADILEDDETPSALAELHREIISGQVRRYVVNSLVHEFGESAFKITVQSNGWLLEGAILVDWNTNIYTVDKDDEGDYIRRGGEVRQTDKSYEFIKLESRTIDGYDIDVSLNGDVVSLTEKEIEFLGKVNFILGRWKYHPDVAFWEYVEETYDIGGDK